MERERCGNLFDMLFINIYDVVHQVARYKAKIDSITVNYQPPSQALGLADLISRIVV